MIEQTAALIQRDFQLVDGPPTVGEAELMAFLERVMEHLLEHELERLLNILYRLDIDEQKVCAVLSPRGVQPPAQALAALVWERECQKAQSRLEHQSSEEEDEDVTRW